MRAGTWEHPKRKRRLTGKWDWDWTSNRFIICLDKFDSITGEQKRFTVCGDSPEWNRWKLVKENK